MAVRSYDFAGWATKNDLRCSDGRIIRKNAFKDDNGKTVPLVWNHDHSNPENILGHAYLENREDGVYAYCSFNDTEGAKTAKQLLEHGDIGSLSIHANKLKQSRNKDVLHGCIREVSLVLAGANPGALIEFPMLAHGDDFIEAEDEANIYAYIEELELTHGEYEVPDEEEIEHGEKESKEDKEMADSGEKTIGEVFDTLTEEQKTAVYAVIGQALEDAEADYDDDDYAEEDEDVKHNAFESDYYEDDDVLTHAEITEFFAEAKRNKVSSLRDFALEHSIDTEGMIVSEGQQTYGFNDAGMLLPEYKSLNNPPEWIKRDTGWVQKVLGGVHKTPFSRIKSQYANITEDEARAKG